MKKRTLAIDNYILYGELQNRKIFLIRREINKIKYGLSKPIDYRRNNHELKQCKNQKRESMRPKSTEKQIIYHKFNLAYTEQFLVNKKICEFHIFFLFLKN